MPRHATPRHATGKRNLHCHLHPHYLHRTPTPTTFTSTAPPLPPPHPHRAVIRSCDRPRLLGDYPNGEVHGQSNQPTNNPTNQSTTTAAAARRVSSHHHHHYCPSPAQPTNQLPNSLPSPTLSLPLLQRRQQLQ